MNRQSLQRQSVPIVINPKEVETDIPKAIRSLNEAYQQLVKRVIQIEGTINKVERFLDVEL